ncbi:hypothetical protein BC829DRAFT_290132 [Chytridium lagenaria]|nr:hypothetical protein BC829DRAFT_290132 [Chytridium lagenaria]
MEQLLLTFETVVPLIDFITPTTSTSSSSSSPSSSACASQAALASVPASIPPPLAAQSDTGAGELRLMFQGAVSRFKKQALGDYSQPPLLPILVNDDPESYKKLLSEVFVAFNGDLKCPALTSTDCYSQDEIVNRVIQELLHASVQTPNILTLGYRKSSGNSRNNVVGTHAVENNYPNTIVNYVKTEPWERL